MNPLLLVAYPKSYRAEHGAELLACLAEAHPGRKVPPAREVVALVRGGVQEHARAVTDDPARPWWLDGVHLAALGLALLAMVPYLQDVWNWVWRIDPGQHAIAFHWSGWLPWAIGPGTETRILPYGLLPLVAVIALLRGWSWIALVPAGAMVFSGVTGGELFGDQGVVGNGYYGLGVPIFQNNLVLSGLLFASCVLLAASRRGVLRRRSYGWLVPLVFTLFVAGALHLVSYDTWFQRGQLMFEIAVLLAAWWATSATGDFRWCIPVAAFAIVRVTAILTNPTALEYRYVANLTALLGLAVVIPVLIVAARMKRNSTQLR
jgi:hypothetical protein